jgi:hypothetical protein
MKLLPKALENGPEKKEKKRSQSRAKIMMKGYA